MNAISKTIAIAVLAISGCATGPPKNAIPSEKATTDTWGVNIIRIDGTDVPHKEWTNFEKTLFDSDDLRMRLSEMESGTTWRMVSGESPYTWVIWSWDWTNRNVIIQRKAAPAN